MKIDRAWLRKALQDVSTFGQMGFTIVVPPILLCMLANWLKKRFDLGYWIILAAIVIGLLSAFTTIAKLCKYFLAKNTKENEKNRNISYQKHL